MSIIMDFTTTAMARPDIVHDTYATFSKNLEGIDLKQCRLFINIDPLPVDGDREKVVKVGKKFFGEVYANLPDKPNYTEAYNWIWSNAETKFIFNLEDDWGLMEPVSIPMLLKYFDDGLYPELLEVALRAYTYPYKSCPTSPSIMHERFYKAVGGKLNPKVNPEMQLRGNRFGIFMPARSLGVRHEGRIICYPEDTKRVILKDLGRVWLEKSEYAKPNIQKDQFVAWIKKDKKHKDELTVLADKFDCDKGTIKHNYTVFYNKYFHSIRNDQFNMLEIGYGGGLSTKMWLYYFQNIMLYIFYYKKRPQEFSKKGHILRRYTNEGRLKYVQGDQWNAKHLKQLDGDYKIIIDDGTHVTEDVQFTMGHLFKRLEPGGIYVIEDLDCNRKHNPVFGYEAPTVISLLKEAKYDTGKLTNRLVSREMEAELNEWISSIDIFMGKIAFIRKKKDKKHMGIKGIRW